MPPLRVEFVVPLGEVDDEDLAVLVLVAHREEAHPPGELGADALHVPRVIGVLVDEGLLVAPQDVPNVELAAALAFPLALVLKPVSVPGEELADLALCDLVRLQRVCADPGELGVGFVEDVDFVGLGVRRVRTLEDAIRIVEARAFDEEQALIEIAAGIVGGDLELVICGEVNKNHRNYILINVAMVYIYVALRISTTGKST
ncbi:hypothetical protein [Aurantimonas sp. HBX-1]|uniref:hypothetical protein n=1 Tax=Aurantimonas sp. HBX-1 TaxID=2906072 RepID=UPI001F1D7741|nr:hypothetical protein [Aurantimonas sp. HBX-1]UIJ73351.1 hypothetical protein LXB15_06840 [Aurantimonas sp. HBX-1]